MLTGIQALAVDSDTRGLLLLNSRQQIRLINNTLRNWIGLDWEQTVRKLKLKDLFYPSADFMSFISQAMTAPYHRHQKIINIKVSNKVRPLLIVIEPIRQGFSGKPYWLILITDQSFNNQLQQAKMWTQMAQKVAHDIKNPLSAILLSLQQLQLKYQKRIPEASVEFDPYVSRIMERIESLRQMTRNFMKFVNIENKSLSTVQFNDFLNEICENIRLGLPSDIDLEFKRGENPLTLQVDTDQIQSVVENLVANAINAMPEGGRITVSTLLAQGLQLNGLAGEPRDYVLLEVLDTGIGIPEQDRELLFDPDFTASEGGLGLGLSMVKKIIDDHDGHIDVTSEPGTGTVFSIYLPIN
ncbi:MAG: hypothetical protein GWP06_17565 [Actinobacteria bacterium]|nr:hypothetical protein [Actinomycetota bacterium]